MRYILPILLILSMTLGNLVAPVAAFFQGPDNPTLPDANWHYYLPFINGRGGVYSISGVVTDVSGKALAGALVADQFGHTALTDDQGRYNLSALKPGDYSIAPGKDGYVFTPSMTDIRVGANVKEKNFKAVTACKEAITNGGFETDTTGWSLSVAGSHQGAAARVTTKAHGGAASTLMGVLPGAAAREGYSFIRQNVSIPSDASGATLRMFIWPISDEAPAGKSRQPAFNPATFPEELSAQSSQYVIVTDDKGNILKQSWSDLKNKTAWTLAEFNIFTDTMKGKTVTLEIGTYNTVSSHTALYVDDVSVSLCGGSMAPVVAPPPVDPTACSQLLVDPGFESTNGWRIPATEFSARYTTAINHTAGGTRAMQTGITPSYANRYSYSDAYQVVNVPYDAEIATLSMWIYTQATSAYSKKPLPAAPEAGVKFAPDEYLANDVQYVLILDPWGYIQQVLLWQNADARIWQNITFDLARYAGTTIRIQFGTANDGWDGISAMFVDDTTLDYCNAGTTPTPTTTVAPTTPVPTTPVATTPAATLTVPACRELIGEGGFETYASPAYWGIPVTSFSANWASKQRHAGVYAMRAGIPNAAHNRYSYSDFFQVVHVPWNATSAVLQFYEYPIGDSYTAWSEQSSDSYLYGDVQYLLVLDYWGNWIDTLMWEYRNDQAWLQRQVDLTYYWGETIRLQWGVYNDGWDGVTSMYIDDVTFGVCP